MKTTFEKVLKVCTISIFIIDFILIVVLYIRTFKLGFDVFNDQVCITIENIIYFVSTPLLFVFGTAYIIFDYAYKRALDGINNRNIAKIVCFSAFVVIVIAIMILWFVFGNRLFNSMMPN